ncbi:hypothetical protein MMC28_009282 [Mycoblastus sanguinarius]|nr:hypothetical protein [Mycoblastus sanguinarius]
MDETFTLLPLHLDPTTKAVSSPSDSLSVDLTALKTLQRALLSQPQQIPPPPLPTNPKRSAQIQKMRDQGNASLRTSKSSPSPAQAQEAIKLYTYGIEMALGRPGWEPSGLVREEAGILYANRAQAYMAAQMWAEGAGDGETSVELKKAGNGKAWWRRGRCLCEMGWWEEAREWVTQGLEVEGNEGELNGLMKEIIGHFKSDDEKK